MQPEFLARLSEPVQQFIRDVERDAGIEIIICLDPRQNDGGTDLLPLSRTRYFSKESINLENDGHEDK